MSSNHSAAMNRKIECRIEGCAGEVFYKPLQAERDHNDRRPESMRYPNGRGSPMAFNRYSAGPGQMSPYCKQHTCIHFLREETCYNSKPPHDSVCAIHAKCPIQDCTQARAQFLDPNYDPLSGNVPRYIRFEVCAEHKCIMRQCPRRRASPVTTYCQAHACQADDCPNMSREQSNCCEDHECKTEGCRTIVDGDYPYCSLHIKCEMRNCSTSKHWVSKTNEYLAFCTNHALCSAPRCKDIKLERSPFCPNHTCRERDCSRSTHSQRPYCNEHACAELGCMHPRPWNPKPKNRGKYCPLHTCRAQECHEFVDSLGIFCSDHGCSKPKCREEAIVERLCLDHLKAHYMAQGELQAMARVAKAPRRYTHTPSTSRLDDDDSSTHSSDQSSDEQDHSSSDDDDDSLDSGRDGAPAPPAPAPSTKPPPTTGSDLSHRSEERKDRSPSASTTKSPISNPAAAAAAPPAPTVASAEDDDDDVGGGGGPSHPLQHRPNNNKKRAPKKKARGSMAPAPTAGRRVSPFGSSPTSTAATTLGEGVDFIKLPPGGSRGVFRGRAPPPAEVGDGESELW